MIKNKITWNTLFTPKKKIICDECFFKYPLNITYSTFPFSSTQVKLYSLFDTTYDIDSFAFAYEMGKLFSFIFKNENGTLIFMNKLDYNFVENCQIDKYIAENLVFITYFV